jgi:hypothetical protein
MRWELNQGIRCGYILKINGDNWDMRDSPEILVYSRPMMSQNLKIMGQMLLSYSPLQILLVNT